MQEHSICVGSDFAFGDQRVELLSISHGPAESLDDAGFRAWGPQACLRVTSASRGCSQARTDVSVGVGSLVSLEGRRFVVSAVEREVRRCLLREVEPDVSPVAIAARDSAKLYLQDASNAVGDWRAGDEPVFTLIRRYQDLRREGREEEAARVSRGVAAAFGCRVPLVDGQALRFFDECGAAPGSERIAGVVLSDAAYFRAQGDASQSHRWHSDGSWYHYALRVALKTAELERYAGRVLLAEARELALIGDARRLVEVLFTRDAGWVRPRWAVLARANWEQTLPLAQWLQGQGVTREEIVALLAVNQSYRGLHDLRRFCYQTWPMGTEREAIVAWIERHREAALRRDRQRALLALLHRRMFVLAAQGVGRS